MMSIALRSNFVRTADVIVSVECSCHSTLTITSGVSGTHEVLTKSNWHESTRSAISVRPTVCLSVCLCRPAVCITADTTHSILSFCLLVSSVSSVMAVIDVTMTNALHLIARPPKTRSVCQSPQCNHTIAHTRRLQKSVSKIWQKGSFFHSCITSVCHTKIWRMLYKYAMQCIYERGHTAYMHGICNGCKHLP